MNKQQEEEMRAKIAYVKIIAKPEEIEAITKMEALFNKAVSSIRRLEDHRPKEVGDRVKIWDFSGCIDEEGNKPLKFPMDYSKTEGIVSAIGLKKVVTKDLSNFGGLREALKLKEKPMVHTFKHDLAIVYPNGKTLYTSSEFVARVDKQLV